DGAEEIIKKIKNNQLSTSKLIYHFVDNLYVLIIPQDKDKEIEDLFEDKILSTKVNGKIFNREKEINVDKEYGKYVFANKVIKSMQQSINFDGFKEVFDGLRLIIEDYQKRRV
ncbi:MAG: ribonuclease H, partial [Deltaproteobacteria bacterium]|nr:ribonuclease H [Deltaproteobacteria bacterium]